MVNVENLRRDYMLVASWMVRYEEWTGQEAQEIGAEIKAALAAKDEGYLAFWAEWFERYAEMARCHQAEMERLDQAARDWVAEQRRAVA